MQTHRLTEHDSTRTIGGHGEQECDSLNPADRRVHLRTLQKQAPECQARPCAEPLFSDVATTSCVVVVFVTVLGHNFGCLTTLSRALEMCAYVRAKEEARDNAFENKGTTQLNFA